MGGGNDYFTLFVYIYMHLSIYPSISGGVSRQLTGDDRDDDQHLHQLHAP
jgi:hypothetical protein